MADWNGTSVLRAQMWKTLRVRGRTADSGTLARELKVFASWTSDLTWFLPGVGWWLLLCGARPGQHPLTAHPGDSEAPEGWQSNNWGFMVLLEDFLGFFWLAGCEYMWKLDLFYLWSSADASLIKSPLNLEMLVKTGRDLKLALSTEWRSCALRAH